MNGSKSKGDGEIDVSNLPRAQNYIFGQFEDTDTYIDSYEPSTGKVWALIPNSNGKMRCIDCYEMFKPLILPSSKVIHQI